MSTTQPTPPIRPYRRFLTSALHRRFVHASALALIVCWNDAFWLGQQTSYFWSWFPISLTGVRAGLIFVSCLAVFILRVSSLQIGRRTTRSPFDTFRRSILGLNTIQTLGWYLFSAWWFSEVYIWSSSTSENLGWIVKGDMSTPDRLNERPIYLRSISLWLAFCQTGLHIYNDYSSVHVPISFPNKNAASNNPTHKLAPFSTRIQLALPKVIQRCAIISATTAIVGPFVYTLFLRQTFWKWHLRFAKLIYSLPSSEARPIGYPPSSPQFMLRSFGVGFLLMLTWATTSVFFSVLLCQEPLRKDQPLSAGSKDAHGTLITGLRAKRHVVKSFAFWELVIIAQRYPERRKAIFADIERGGGPAWGQMLDAGLEILRSIDSRIQATTTPAKTAQPSPGTGTVEVDSLPRIAPAIKEKPIFAGTPRPQTRTQEIESYIDWGARRIGQSEHPFHPSVSKGKPLLKYVGRVGIPVEKFSPGVLVNHAKSLLQSSAVGVFCKTTFERKVNSVILGSPQGNGAVIVDAIEATTRMLVSSLSEDLYGRVISGVPRTVRTFTSTINAIEAFVHNVKEEASEDTDIEEVEIVLARLKAGLAELLSAFQLYLSDQGLSAAEHRQAQNASTPGRLLPEREERRKEKEEADRADRADRERLEAEKAKEQKELLARQPSGDVSKHARKEDGPDQGKGKAREGERDRDRERERERERGKENDDGERRRQKRLEPQDPARKKLFQDTRPKKMGSSREMEMVR